MKYGPVETVLKSQLLGYLLCEKIIWRKMIREKQTVFVTSKNFS